MKNNESLQDTNPTLAKEWHPTKNLELLPENVSPHSGKKVWWICSKGHEWPASIYDRSKGRGCPYCSGRIAVKGVNDLATINPELAKEWNYSKNGDLTPDNTTAHSNKKVWWICSKGHEWPASVTNRAKGKGCPICSNRQVLPGYNDLATINPELASEWHPSKNNGLIPNNILAGSHEKVWWLCKNGHEWPAEISSRMAGHGCPYCSNRLVWPGYNDLATINPELASEWHPSKNGALTPSDVLATSTDKAWWICSEGHEWPATIGQRLAGSGCPYCNKHTVLKGFNDLETLNPQLAKEWHPTKNGNLTPAMVTLHSEKEVWWICSKGHEWPASVTSRSNGCGCVYCSNKKVLAGFNDLATLFPNLAKEWHPTKNGKLSPQDVVPGSDKKIWWICSKGHEWPAVLPSRVNGTGCPICAKERQTSFPEQAIYFYISKCFHDAVNGDKTVLNGLELDVYIPSIKYAVEYDGKHWHSNEERDTRKNEECEKQGIQLIRVREKGLTTLSCQCIIRSSDSDESLNKAIYEVLKALDADFTFKIDVVSDYSNIMGEYILQEKESSFAKLYPDLAKEWHPYRNGSVLPDMIAAGSDKKVWWQCAKGHEWPAMVSTRVRGTGCPYCSGRKVLFGFNDLATKNPALAKEWHPTKNNDITPSMVSSGSDRVVWWQCAKGHEWPASISHRVTDGTGCPFCSGRKAVTGENDLVTQAPSLATEWHPTKNGDLTPQMVTINSGRKVWWQCSKGHEWPARIIDRTLKDKGCPFCKNRIVLPGFNDLATVNPNLAKEWHPTKNGDLLPSMVVAGSGKKVWWMCSEGHEWQTTVVSRNNGCGCQECYNNRRQKKLK